MCTASWLTEHGRLHFFFNRDELTTRERARPPALDERRGVRFVAPTDARAGGTWIAATELGSVLALFNKSGGARPAEPLSRGELIPALVASRDSRELVAGCRALSLERFAPFRLAALWRDPGAGVAVAWDGARLTFEELDGRLGLLASSGLGDERALERRGATWRRWRAEREPWVFARHRDFHRDHSPRRGAWSVCVHRREASTVSYTEVEIGARDATLRYFDGSPCAAAEPVELRLARARDAARRSAS